MAAGVDVSRGSVLKLALLAATLASVLGAPQQLLVVRRVDLVVLAHVGSAQPVGDERPCGPVDPDPLDSDLPHARGHGLRTARRRHQDVGRDVVADLQHQLQQVVHRDLQPRVVQQVADRARGDVDVVLVDLDEVVEPEFATIHHREDLHRDRHLVGARHREELFAVQRDPASRLQVVGPRRPPAPAPVPRAGRPRRPGAPDRGPRPEPECPARRRPLRGAGSRAHRSARTTRVPAKPAGREKNAWGPPKGCVESTHCERVLSRATVSAPDPIRHPA